MPAKILFLFTTSSLRDKGCSLNSNKVWSSIITIDKFIFKYSFLRLNIWSLFIIIWLFLSRYEKTFISENKWITYAPYFRYHPWPGEKNEFHRASINQHWENKERFMRYYYLDLFVHPVFHLAIFYTSFQTLIRYELFRQLPLAPSNLKYVTFHGTHSTQWQILSWHSHSKLYLLFLL